jgi:hypothetical protein
MSESLQQLRELLDSSDSGELLVSADLLRSALDEIEAYKTRLDKIHRSNLQNYLVQLTRANRAFNDPRITGKNNQANAALDALGIKGRKKNQNRYHTHEYALLLLGKHPNQSLTLGALNEGDSRKDASAKKREAVTILADAAKQTYAAMRQRIVRGIEEDIQRPPESRLTLEIRIEDLPFPPNEYETTSQTKKR